MWRGSAPAPWSTFRHAAHPGTKVPRNRAIGRGDLPFGARVGSKVEEKVERARQCGATRTGSRPTDLSYRSYRCRTVLTSAVPLWTYERFSTWPRATLENAHHQAAT